MAKSKTSRAWIHEHVTDLYVRRAKAEGYRSRAAYKLMDLDRKDRLLRPGMTVVDLGAAPGGWTQVAVERVGPQGRVIAVDLLPMAPLAGAEIVEGDFGDDAVLELVTRKLGGQADLVISDMAPNLSGEATVDQGRILHLAELALEFSRLSLKPGGALLVKVFHGEGFDGFVRAMREVFDRVAVRKPQSSRSRSSEVYLLGAGRRAGAGPGG